MHTHTQSNNAQQLWFSMETHDHITDNVEWAEVRMNTSFSFSFGTNNEW